MMSVSCKHHYVNVLWHPTRMWSALSTWDRCVPWFCCAHWHDQWKTISLRTLCHRWGKYNGSLQFSSHWQILLKNCCLDGLFPHLKASFEGLWNRSNISWIDDAKKLMIHGQLEVGWHAVPTIRGSSTVTLGTHEIESFHQSLLIRIIKHNLSKSDKAQQPFTTQYLGYLLVQKIPINAFYKQMIRNIHICFNAPLFR